MGKLVMPKSVKLGCSGRWLQVTILHSKSRDVLGKKHDICPAAKNNEIIVNLDNFVKNVLGAILKPRHFQVCNLGENWTNSSPGHQDLFLPIGHNWHSLAMLTTKDLFTNPRKLGQKSIQMTIGS